MFHLVDIFSIKMFFFKKKQKSVTSNSRNVFFFKKKIIPPSEANIHKYFAHILNRLEDLEDLLYQYQEYSIS